ncbi:Uncharacterised protein [Mycobacteroides abscessus]|nr:Uncharacterised protein [Mycobacteroides abscessus]
MTFQGHQNLSQGIRGMGIIHHKQALSITQHLHPTGRTFELWYRRNQTVQVKPSLLHHNQTGDQIFNIEMAQQWTVNHIFSRSSF